MWNIFDVPVCFSQNNFNGAGLGDGVRGQFIQWLALDGTDTKGHMDSAVLQMTTATLLGWVGGRVQMADGILSPYLEPFEYLSLSWAKFQCDCIPAGSMGTPGAVLQ